MKRATKPSGGKNVLEWTVFAGSCLLIATVITVLIVEIRSWEDRPARLEARLGTAMEEDGWLRVPVEVANHGDHVAEHVRIEVLRITSSGEQRAELSFDSVPRDTSRRGSVGFRASDKSPASLSVEVIGHEEP